jgi:hypothetical protein
MRNKDEIRLQRVVAFLCATLFVVFSFFFVSHYQSPLIELLYDHVATGKLEYNGYVVGAILTVLLTLFAVWLNRFSKFQREWTALSYLPSVLLLAFVTDIDRTVYTGGSVGSKWLTVFAVGAFAYAAFSFVLQRVLFAKIKNVAMSASRIIWRNMQIFVILFCLAGILSNGEENLKREALVHSYYKKGKVDKALAVGYRSRTASQYLTAQRAYILASEGMLGDKLFEYPQQYGSDGLVPAPQQQSPLVPDSVYSLIGAVPSQGERASALLARAVASDSLIDASKDYYLSALLLDRRLVEFVNTVTAMYDSIPADELPKHYQEALMLYASIDDEAQVKVENTALQEQFDAFRALEKEHDDPFVRSNYVRRKFGRTYWWYYLYGNV